MCVCVCQERNHAETGTTNNLRACLGAERPGEEGCSTSTARKAVPTGLLPNGEGERSTWKGHKSRPTRTQTR